MKCPDVTEKDVVDSICKDPLNGMTHRSTRNFGLPEHGIGLRRMQPHTWASVHSTVHNNSPRGLLAEIDTMDKHPLVRPGFLEFDETELAQFGLIAPPELRSPTQRYEIAAGYQQDDRGIEGGVMIPEQRSISRRAMEWVVGNLTTSLSAPERTLSDAHVDKLLQETDFKGQFEGIKDRVINDLRAGKITRLSRDPLTIRALKELDKAVQQGEIEGVTTLLVRPVYLKTLHKPTTADSFNIHSVRDAAYCIDVSASPGEKFVNISTLLQQDPTTDHDIYTVDPNEPVQKKLRGLQDRYADHAPVQEKTPLDIRREVVWERAVEDLKAGKTVRMRDNFWNENRSKREDFTTLHRLAEVIEKKMLPDIKNIFLRNVVVDDPLHPITPTGRDYDPFHGGIRYLELSPTQSEGFVDLETYKTHPFGHRKEDFHFITDAQQIEDIGTAEAALEQDLAEREKHVIQPLTLTEFREKLDVFLAGIELTTAEREKIMSSNTGHPSRIYGGDIVFNGTHIPSRQEQIMPMREIHERTLRVLEMLAEV